MPTDNYVATVRGNNSDQLRTTVVFPFNNTIKDENFKTLQQQKVLGKKATRMQKIKKNSIGLLTGSILFGK